MNNKSLVGLAVFVALLAGAFGGYAAYKLAPQLGGDFAGGITPTNLLTANTATNGVTPIGSLNFGFGGTAAANQIVTLDTATTAYPSTVTSLGPITANNSATSTQVPFIASGFSVGDACEVSYNGTTSTNAFGADAFVTAVSGNNVTSTATFWNGSTATSTLTVTSTATGASSTLKLTCFHPGV